MSKRRDLLARTWRAGSSFLIFVGLYLGTKTFFLELPSLVEHLLLVLSAMTGVHLLERAFLWKDIATWNQATLQKILRLSFQILDSAAIAL